MKIIGLGNKARNGKDSLANFIKNKLGDKCHILHFADALYEECRNLPHYQNSINYLIVNYGGSYFIKSGNNQYIKLTCNEISDKFDEWVRLNTKGEYGHYLGMEEKDPLLLQWWGTDFRRKHFGDNYWTKKIEDRIISAYSNSELNNDSIILIPDTRFKNEYDMITEEWNPEMAEGFIQTENYYISVNRYTENGTRFISNDRDPNHPSETELDGIEADYTVNAKNLQELEAEADNIIKKFNL